MANQVKTIFVGDTKPQDRAVAKLQADLAKYQAQRERDEQRLTQSIAKEAEARYRIQVRNQQRATQDILTQLRRIEREEERITRERNARIRAGVSSAAPYVLGGAVGAGYLAQQAIDKAIEQSRANRLLASAATEAGVAQDRLAEANKRFAASVGLSNAAAAQTTAQIQRLATYAGRPQDVDRLLKAFADLGAARGIGGRDLETLIGTILSGQDEGLNRLGISDPGQLQKAYAESIGKTTEQLTQQEKVQAAVNAVMEKAAIFTGAAESRMNSLEGQVARTAAQWENFTNALATTFTTSGPVTDFLNETSRLMGKLSVDIDTVNRKLKEGKTPEQIARELYPRPSTGDSLTAASTALFTGTGLLGGTGLFGETIRRATDPNIIAERRRKEFEAQIRAQQEALAAQERAAYDARAAATIKTYTDLQNQQREQIFGPAAIKKALADVERQASLLLQKPNVTLQELRSGLRGLDNLGLSDLDTLNLRQDYERKILEEQKRRADELKRKFEEVKKAKESLFDAALSGSTNPFSNFLGNVNREMRTMLETAKELSPALRETFQGQVEARNRTALFGLRLDTDIDAEQLRRQAREFRQGFRNENDPAFEQRARYFASLASRLGDTAETFQSNYERFLAEERRQGFQTTLSQQIAAITRRRATTDEERALQNQRLINLGQNLDPEQLLDSQRQLFASAFEREAARRIDAERQATSFYQKMESIIFANGLKVTLDDGAHVVRVVNEAPNNARVERRPRAADAANHYGN